MHIPDGYLSPQTYVPMFGVAAAFWVIAMRKIRAELSDRHVPYLAMAAAFSFLIQMFNVPVPGGTTGHAVGGAIIAILLGPWPAVLAISMALIIQAIVFGDGGITAIGANCFNMAIVMPFVSYWIFNLIKGKEQGGRRTVAAAFLAGYLGLVVASISTAVMFGIQPMIAQDAQGLPLYAPYPLSVAVPVMAIEHLVLFGIIEGAVTGLILKYFMKHERNIIHAFNEV